MLTKKKVSTLILTSTLVLFSACGGGGGSSGSDTPTSSSNRQIVPSNINVAIPPSLKANRNAGTTTPKPSFQKASFKANSTAVPSRGYSELQTTISMAEEVIKSTKENMVYLNSMMPDIQSECQYPVINTPCTIPADTIILTITSQINQELAKVAQEFNAPAETPLPVGTTLILGQVKYTEFNTTKPYQYDVLLDLKPALNRLHINVTKDLETVRWSADKNSVQTLSDVQDSSGSYTMNLTYKKEDNGSAFMKINDTFNITTQPQVSGLFSLTLKDLKDAQNSVQVDSTGTINDGTNGTITFSSKGEVTDSGGSLTSKGEFGGNKFAEKESFDGQGALKQSKYCDDTTCNLNDETSWHTFDENLGIDNNDTPITIDLPNDNTDNEPIYIVQAIGGNLTIKNSYESLELYYLIPNDIDLSSHETVQDNKIASISVFKNDAGGLDTVVVPLNLEYINSLNDLSIVYLDKRTNNYVKIAQEDKPTFSVEYF